MEAEQKAFEDSKNRILVEFSTEKDRLLKEIQQKEQDLEMQRDKSLKEKKEMAEQLNREFTEKMRLIEKRNQVNGYKWFCSITTAQSKMLNLFENETIKFPQSQYLVFG